MRPSGAVSPSCARACMAFCPCSAFCMAAVGQANHPTGCTRASIAGQYNALSRRSGATPRPSTTMAVVLREIDVAHLRPKCLNLYHLGATDRACCGRIISGHPPPIVLSIQEYVCGALSLYSCLGASRARSTIIWRTNLKLQCAILGSKQALLFQSATPGCSGGQGEKAPWQSKR